MVNLITRRDHRGAATTALLTGGMSPSDTTFSISTNIGWPTGSVGPFFVVVDPGTGSEEKILVASQSTSVCTVASGGRGVDNTIAKTHAVNATCYPCWTSTEADELNVHGATSAAVHGVAGNVVGDTDAQTLSNKTISGASNTLSAIPAATAITGLLPIANGGTNAVDAATARTNLGVAVGTNVEAWSAKLDGVAAIATTTGLVAQTAAATFTGRTLTSANTKITVANGTGAAGDPTLTINEANFTGIPQAAVTGLAAIAADLNSRQRIVWGYTASATWTKPAAANFLGVWTISTGGGGGGGGVGTAAASQGCAASGGGAANTALAWIPAASLSATETVTIGAGGAAGSNAGGSGGTGGGTTFGAHLTANGGNPGTGDTSGANTGGRTGGAPSGGAGGTVDLSVGGGGGGAGIKIAAGAMAVGGIGGASYWGGGGQAALTTSGSTVGATSTAYGSGGSGAAAVGSGNAAGGAGAGGVCWVAETYG